MSTLKKTDEKFIEEAEDMVVNVVGCCGDEVEFIGFSKHGDARIFCTANGLEYHVSTSFNLTY